MEFDSNIEHLRLAFWNVVLAAGPILGDCTGNWSFYWDHTGCDIYQ